jgi:hypothetical protein
MNLSAKRAPSQIAHCKQESSSLVEVAHFAVYYRADSSNTKYRLQSLKMHHIKYFIQD